MNLFHCRARTYIRVLFLFRSWKRARKKQRRNRAGVSSFRNDIITLRAALSMEKLAQLSALDVSQDKYQFYNVCGMHPCSFGQTRMLQENLEWRQFDLSLPSWITYITLEYYLYSTCFFSLSKRHGTVLSYENIPQ